MIPQDYEVICDWFFSNKTIESYTESDQRVLRLAQYILISHGVGGKFAETLVNYKYGITPPDTIHGWDGFLGDKPVEIKTETINKKNLAAMASFADNRESSRFNTGELFIEHRPLLINVGLAVDGKCIYVMFTDTKNLPLNAPLFKELRKKSPRTRWGQYRDYRSKASTVVYINKSLVNMYEQRINKKFFADLKGMTK